MAHEESISDDLWVHVTLVAVFLLKCLRLTSFFQDIPVELRDEVKVEDDKQSLTPNELFVTTVLLRLINVMPCNSHDVSEFETPVLDSFVPGARKVGDFQCSVTKLTSLNSVQPLSASNSV